MGYQRRAMALNGKFQTRAEDGKLYIEGYFAVFGGQYRLWDNAYETIEPGAFDGQTGEDIRALVNHDSTLVLGRTTVGTLTLKQNEQGLWGVIEINQADQDAMNLYERVKRGDVSQCSFGFDILDEWTEQKENGVTIWHIRKVKLYEVSVVTFPAYESTEVQARKTSFENIAKRKAEVWRKTMQSRLKGVQNGTESTDATP